MISITEAEFCKMIDRTVESDPNFVQPIPTSTLLEMKMVRQKLNEAKERLHQKEWKGGENADKC